MSKKIGKFFKKAGKTIKNTASDTVDTLEDTAKDTVKETENIANDASDIVVNISKDAIHATEKGFNAALEESKKLLDDAQKAILKAAAMDVIRKHDKEITALTNAVIAIVNNPKLKSAVEKVAKKAAYGNLDNEVTQVLSEIFTAPEVKIHLKDIAPTTWPTITLGVSGGGGYVAGVEASGGLGVTHPGLNNGQLSGFIDAGGSLGTFGGSASVMLGVATSRPANIDGGYIGVTVEAKVGVGAGLEIEFNMPNFSLGGITVAAGVGMKASAALTGGYTYVASKVDYKTPW
jgi:hypothetical protein